MTSYNICNIPFKLPRHRHFLSIPVMALKVASLFDFDSGSTIRQSRQSPSKTYSLHSSVLFQTLQTQGKDFNGNNSKQIYIS